MSWEPMLLESYFYVSFYMGAKPRVNSAMRFDHHDDVDRLRLRNCFQTHEEAQDIVDVFKLLLHTNGTQITAIKTYIEQLLASDGSEASEQEKAPSPSL